MVVLISLCGLRRFYLCLIDIFPKKLSRQSVLKSYSDVFIVSITCLAFAIPLSGAH